MRARVPTPRESRPSKHEETKIIPRPYKLRRFYTPKEVALHSTGTDCWVSFFDKVFDLTLLISKSHDSPLCDPIILAAGTDITHWFDSETEYVSYSKRMTHSPCSQKHTSIPRPALNSICAQMVASCMSHQLSHTPTGMRIASMFHGGLTMQGSASES